MPTGYYSYWVGIHARRSLTQTIFQLKVEIVTRCNLVVFFLLLSMMLINL